MVSDNTSLGDRMKKYEHVWRDFLPANSYTIVRIDGRAFHSYLQGAERPYDTQFMGDMDLLMKEMCEHMQGVVFGYAQSDEVSFLLTDFETPQKQAWFGGNRDKIVSIAAAHATALFLHRIRPDHGFATFDARAFTLPNAVEVANYFVWRQRDATRNSILMAGQAYFSHQELQGKNTDEIQEMLFSQHGVNWNNYPDEFKRGRVAFRSARTSTVLSHEWIRDHRDNPDAKPLEGDYETRTSSFWAVDPAPRFQSEPDTWLAYSIPAMPNFES